MSNLTPVIADELKRVIRKSGLKLRRIEREAGVPYWPLYRFMRGEGPDIRLSEAERIYILLTGHSFDGRRRGR